MKRKLIGLLSIVLALAFCFGSFSYAFGALLTKTETIEVPLLQNGDFDLPDRKVDYELSSRGVSTLATTTASDVIYNALLNCQSSFDIYSYRVSLDDFVALYCEVINSHPDLFYVSSTVSYDYKTNYFNRVSYVSNITPCYVMGKNEINDAKIIFENGAQKALSQLDDSMSDVQKCLVLHDYLCNLAKYPNVYDSNNKPTLDKDIYHSAYGIFYDGNVVCAGYTLAYSYLLQRAGIQSAHVASPKMSHAWNKVKINGNWYNVDLTYDDISYNGNGSNTIGAMHHTFFMKSDEAFLGEIGHYHYGGTTVSTANANDTSYDNYFWNGINTFIPVINGDYYYLSPASAQYLMKRTADGVENKVGSSSFSSVSVTFTSTVYDENGTEHTLESVDYMNRLIYLDNRFYINSNKAIYSYSYLNGAYKKSTIESGLANYVVGIGTDDNELSYQLYKDSSTQTLNKLEYFRNNISRENSKIYNNYADINLDGFVNAKDYVIIKNTK